jgi:hypothetical protein
LNNPSASLDNFLKRKLDDGKWPEKAYQEFEKFSGG